MKTVLSIIFSFVVLYCSAQQTRFFDLKSAHQQPQNVKFLSVNCIQEALDLSSLQVFSNLNYLELSDLKSDADYASLFTSLAELTQIDTFELSRSGLTILPEQIGKLQFLTCLKINQCRSLKSIPNEIKQLKNLTCLELTLNYSLTMLPDIFDSLSSLKVLKMDNNKLVELPQSICSLATLEELLLYQNNLTFLPEKIVELKQLKHLSLSGNPLTHLPIHFKELLLEEINIGGNPFVVFPYHVFEISTLKKVTIYSTKLDSLPQSVTRLKDLEYIFLNANNTFDWKGAFVKLDKNEKLSTLNIQANKNVNIPEEIGLLKRLKSLQIKGFGNVPAAICYLSGMTGLTELILPHCDDVFLPESVGTLTNLKILKMEYCRLQKLPSSIGKLVSLEELYLTKYYDATPLVIPDEIGSLIQLRILNLTGCNLKKLPASIQNLTKLKELDVSSNDLTEIPQEISYLTSLERLSFYGNKIGAVPDVFGQMSNLKELYLSENRIEKIPAEIWKIKTLETLLLNENNIVAFEVPDTVSTGLKELCLSENIHLKIIPDFFAELTDLERLDLECTQVTQLPDGLKKNVNLEKIELSENLIHNKKALNKEFGGIIEFDGDCDQLTQLAVNYHDVYGKIKTDIKTTQDSITLYYHYSYDYPGSIDEEYDENDENVFFTLKKEYMKSGSRFTLPDSNIRVDVLHLSIWDILIPEGKFEYKNIQGQISFIAVKKNEIKTHIYLFCDGYEDTKKVLIDHKVIVFKKKK